MQLRRKIRKILAGYGAEELTAFVGESQSKFQNRHLDKFPRTEGGFIYGPLPIPQLLEVVQRNENSRTLNVPRS